MFERILTMTDNGTLILVEGLDLAGKTSARDNLVARLLPRPDHRRNALADRNPFYLAADQLRRADRLDRAAPGARLLGGLPAWT